MCSLSIREGCGDAEKSHCKRRNRHLFFFFFSEAMSLPRIVGLRVGETTEKVLRCSYKSLSKNDLGIEV